MQSLAHARRTGRFLVYPLRVPPRPRFAEAVVLRTGRWAPMRCTVCGALDGARAWGRDVLSLRDSGLCRRCGATNRQRQLAWLVCDTLGARSGARVRSVEDAGGLRDLVVYNTETKGPLHQRLARMDGYLASEYFGPELDSGGLVDGVMHQDLQRLSFPDESIDLVLSSDVLEHVADPYRAHAEILRVLRPGGHHLFTVPFHQTLHLDERRAVVDERGDVRHLTEPMYHLDPIRPEGVLVFTIFSLEMLVRLRELGFDTAIYRLYSPWHGILGPNGIVFDALKPPKRAG